MEGAVDRVMMRRLFGKPSWAVVAGVIPPLLVLVIVGVVLLIRFPPGQMAYIGLAYMLFPLFMLLFGIGVAGSVAALIITARENRGVAWPIIVLLINLWPLWTVGRHMM